MKSCNHKDHAGGHGPRASGLPGCHCGNHSCQICPDVKLVRLGQVRRFESGATRDTDEGKLDFEAYLNPLVLLEYARYMQEHQARSDGTKRAGDDWQKGMPSDVYMKSLWRHMEDVWLLHRGYDMDARTDKPTALCAIIFNAMGMLYNELHGKQ